MLGPLSGPDSPNYINIFNIQVVLVSEQANAKWLVSLNGE